MEPSEVQAASETNLLAGLEALAIAESTPSSVAVVESTDAVKSTDQDFDPSETEVVDPYVLVSGRIKIRYPNLALENEVNQARARLRADGMTDQEALRTLLKQPQNRYLVRLLCWVLAIDDQDTYFLAPRDPVDFDLLIGAVRPDPRPTDIDAVIGVRGPIAPPQMCGGLTLPVLVFDQINSFDLGAFVGALPVPDGIPSQQFQAVSERLFWSITTMSDNYGATGEHRALNYIALRYPAFYAEAAGAFKRNLSLASVDVVPSRLSNSLRDAVDVIFHFANRDNGVMEKSFVRVDVTEKFPFLTNSLSPYLDR